MPPVPYTSKTLSEARRHSIHLYRHALKAIPYIVKTYELELNMVDMKNRIRSDFEIQRAVDSVAVADRLCFLGRAELEEVQKLWKQKAHIEKYFILENKPIQQAYRTFSDYSSVRPSSIGESSANAGEDRWGDLGLNSSTPIENVQFKG